MSALTATCTVLAVWVGLFVMLAGLGRGVVRLALGGDRSDLLWSSWIGYGTLIVLLQLWHLFWPVDSRALVVVLLLALAGWALTKRPPRRLASASQAPIPHAPPAAPATNASEKSGLALAMLTAVAWAANRSIGPNMSFDSANYQTPLVVWYHAHPLVPGLANLNPLFGLGPSGLLAPALLESGAGSGRSFHFANGFVWALLIVTLLLLVSRRQLAGHRRAAAAAVVFLFPTLFMAMRGEGSWISSHTTDLPLVALLFAASCALLSGTDEKKNAPGQTIDLPAFAGLALLGVIPSLKATFVVYAALAWGLALLGPRGEMMSTRSPRPLRPLRPLIAAAGLAVLANGAWLARNVILSGYPLYPIPFAPFPVDWRLPREYVEGYLWWTRAYSRTPGDWAAMLHQQGFSWVPQWLRTELRPALEEAVVPLLLIGLLLPGRLAHWRKSGARPRGVYLALGAALGFWFLTTPLVRYGFALFWILAAQLAADLLAHGVRLPHFPAGWPFATAAAIVAPLFIHGYYASRQRPASLAPLVARLAWVPGGIDHGFHPLPRPALRTVSICGGREIVRLPAASDRSRDAERWEDTLPWGSPPPAATMVLPGLCPREAGGVRSGFRIVPDRVPWEVGNAASVRRLRQETGWNEARLAVHFFVRPELITAALAQPDRPARPGEAR